MWIFIRRQWLMVAGAFMLAGLAVAPGFERSSGTFANDKTARALAPRFARSAS